MTTMNKLQTGLDWRANMQVCAIVEPSPSNMDPKASGSQEVVGANATPHNSFSMTRNSTMQANANELSGREGVRVTLRYFLSAVCQRCVSCTRLT